MRVEIADAAKCTVKPIDAADTRPLVAALVSLYQTVSVTVLPRLLQHTSPTQHQFHQLHKVFLESPLLYRTGLH